MAVSNATLKVTIPEECIIEGYDVGVSRTNTVSSAITEYTRRIYEVPTDMTAIINFAGKSGEPGAYALDTTQYIRITNLDTVNFITVMLDHGGSDAYIKVAAGHSLLLGSTNQLIDSDVSLIDLTAIKAEADSAVVDIEWVIAST